MISLFLMLPLSSAGAAPHCNLGNIARDRPCHTSAADREVSTDRSNPVGSDQVEQTGGARGGETLYIRSKRAKAKSANARGSKGNMNPKDHLSGREAEPGPTLGGGLLGQ
jgi:hypothetical protein